MTEHKYKFSIDEPKPQIPAPGNFNALLSAVKVKLPWYAKTSFWGGMATTVIGVTAGIWIYSNKQSTVDNKPIQSQKPTSQIGVSSPQMSAQPVGENNTAVYAFVPPVVLAVQNNQSVEFDFSEGQLLLSKYSIQNAGAIDAHVFSGLDIPYDTFWISTSELPMTLNLRRGGMLHIPLGSILNSEGTQLQGVFMVLYREILDQKDMLLTSLAMETEVMSNEKPLLNNGAFEIRLEQAGKKLYVQKLSPLLINFEVLNQYSHTFGYFTNSNSSAWKPMYIAAVTDAAENQGQSMLTDRMVVKRNFWQWISDVFHGRKVRWDSFERANPNYIQRDISGNSRTFEIRETGYFASAQIMEQALTGGEEVRIDCEGNEHLLPEIYQVFLNQNLVRKYSIYGGLAYLKFNATDRCILLARIENSPYIAALDANSFDRLVKINATKLTPELVFKVVPTSIKTPQDLQNLISGYSKQRPGRD